MSDDLKDLEEIKNEISERIAEVEEASLKTPVYTPQLNKDKELEEQAGDVVKLIGAQKASQNDIFMDKVADNFAKGILTEQETTQMRRERLKSEEYFLKWEHVLKLAHMKEPQGLGLMYTLVISMIVPYLLLKIIGFVFMTFSTIFDFFNTLFNAVFGNAGEILRDKDGKVMIDSVTKKPYRTNPGYNIFAKILLGTIIISLFIAILFAIIYLFTGFNIFQAIKGLFQS